MAFHTILDNDHTYTAYYDIKDDKRHTFKRTIQMEVENDKLMFFNPILKEYPKKITKGDLLTTYYPFGYAVSINFMHNGIVYMYENAGEIVHLEKESNILFLFASLGSLFFFGKNRYICVITSGNDQGPSDKYNY